MSLFKHLAGIAAELLDLPTPEEAARQNRIVTEIPKEKPPIVCDDGTVVYVGRKPDHWVTDEDKKKEHKT